LIKTFTAARRFENLTFFFDDGLPLHELEGEPHMDSSELLRRIDLGGRDKDNVNSKVSEQFSTIAWLSPQFTTTESKLVIFTISKYIYETLESF
jgi:hypothetical protein